MKKRKKPTQKKIAKPAVKASPKPAVAIKKFSKQDAKAVREVVENGLQGWSKRLFGLSAKVGKINVNGTLKTITVPLILFAVDKDKKTGKDITPEVRSWLLNHEKSSLKKEWLYKQLTHKKEAFTIIGLDLRRKKFPVVARQVVTGRIVHITAQEVANKFAAMEKPR